MKNLFVLFVLINLLSCKNIVDQKDIINCPEDFIGLPVQSILNNEELIKGYISPDTSSIVVRFAEDAGLIQGYENFILQGIPNYEFLIRNGKVNQLKFRWFTSGIGPKNKEKIPVFISDKLCLEYKGQMNGVLDSVANDELVKLIVVDTSIMVKNTIELTIKNKLRQ